MFKIKFKIVLIGVFTLLCSAPINAEKLVFGVVPQQSAKKLAQTWSPVLAYVSEHSGIDIVFATAKDIPTFEHRVMNGEYDIAYMNPFHYVVYHELAGYEALAKQRNNSIQGILVAHKDSAIEELAQFSEQTIAFPAPAAFAATLIPQAMLEAEGIDFSSRYVSSHDSVYLNVAHGFAALGGGVKRTLQATDESAKAQLRIIWESPGYTSHAIATSNKVNQETRTKLLEALLSMNDNPEAAALLKAINFKGFVGAENADWDDIRALNIDRSIVNKGG